jgi:CRISPR/Cas system CMR-associated protein Cmr5 small subunit
MPPISHEILRARRAYAAPTSERTIALPAMLQTNGLLSTWAFLLHKKDHALLETLGDHLWEFENQQGARPEPLDMFRNWVGEGEGHLTGARLRRLTAEAIALSAWLKRAAEAAGGDS